MDALRIALADAQTAFSDEDDRRAALGWLLSHLSSLIADSERIDFLDDRTHLYEAPVLDCYGGDRYEVTIGDAKDPLIGNGASLREAIDAAMSALRERSE